MLRSSVRCFASQGKVNDRGKISSRPGPISRKQQQQQQEAVRERAKAEQQVEQKQQGLAPKSEQRAEAASSTTQSSSQPAAPSQPSTSGRVPPQITETPQAVVDRIFPRMVIFAVVPVVFGLVLLYVFYILKKQGGDDFPIWPAYVSQAFTFGGGLLGITYGALSASWDPAREGSAFGWTEFQANLPIFINKGGDKK